MAMKILQQDPDQILLILDLMLPVLMAGNIQITHVFHLGVIPLVGLRKIMEFFKIITIIFFLIMVMD